MTEKTIGAKEFWTAIGQRALGVSVVTAQGTDGPAGFLGLSATHVCADPPLMLVSIDRKTSALGAVLESRHFAINYLPAGSEALANAFGGRSDAKGAERFEVGKWRALTTGAPVFADAVGAIDCQLEETIERHGVVIAIGRVVDFLRGESEPLIFFRGGYR